MLLVSFEFNVNYNDDDVLWSVKQAQRPEVTESVNLMCENGSTVLALTTDKPGTSPYRVLGKVCIDCVKRLHNGCTSRPASRVE